MPKAFFVFTFTFWVARMIFNEFKFKSNVEIYTKAPTLQDEAKKHGRNKFTKIEKRNTTFEQNIDYIETSMNLQLMNRCEFNIFGTENMFALIASHNVYE